MTTMAYGAEKVHALELALGGKPPQDGIQHATAELHRYIGEQFERCKLRHEKMAALLAKQSEFLSSRLNLDKASNAFSQELRETRAKPTTPLKRVSRPKIEPKMVAGSGFWLKAPPYNDQGQAISGDANASPDALNGSYTLGMAGGGGSSSAWAGLAIDFFAVEDNPFQRFAAFAEYDYQWFDDSNNWATATNDASTNIWVWGNTERRWVLQQGNFPPTWNDSINNFSQSNGSGGDGSEQFARQSFEVSFPAFGHNWYRVWIWSSGSCSDVYNFLSGSVASQRQSFEIPFVVFGSL
jgi:hypothetical protein